MRDIFSATLKFLDLSKRLGLEEEAVLMGVLEICLAIAAFAFSYLICGAVFRFAHKFELFDYPDSRRIHCIPTPRLGGVAVFSSILLVALLVFLLTVGGVALNSSIHSWLVLLPGCCIVAVTGLIDDLRQIRPFYKLCGQVLGAGVFLLLSEQSGRILGYEMPAVVVFFMQLFWIVAVINAFNLIDGIDGLATSLGVVAHLSILASLILRGANEELLIVITSMAAFAGFYPWNRHPARMFLGDSGTHVCGFMVACLSQLTGSKTQVAGTLWLAAIAGIVPLIDMLLAVWRRSIRKISSTVSGTSVGGIFTGDLEHVHHRLLERGLDVNTVVAVLTLVNALMVLIGLVAVQSTLLWYPIVVASLTLAIIFLLVFVPRTEIGASLEVLNIIMVRPKSRVISFLVFLVLDFLGAVFSWFLTRGILHETVGLLSVHEVLTAITFGCAIAVAVALMENIWSNFGLPILLLSGSLISTVLWDSNILLQTIVLTVILGVPRGITFVASGFGPGASNPRYFGFYYRLRTRGNVATEENESVVVRKIASHITP